MRFLSGREYPCYADVVRKILHVDMDAFFAAVEQLRRPELRGRPVVVGGDGNPHKRGVVSTASYEAREFGIHSAMPLRTAYKKCPHAVFLPVDFAAYGEYSQRIRAIFHEYTALVEPMSLDEAFLDVSLRPEDPVALAQDIRLAIRERTGLTASVGVGPNKLLAKIASNLHKPDAVTEIRAETVEPILRDLPATVLWGIGPKTAARLAADLNVRTVGELCNIPLAALQALLGEHHGEYLYHTCRGEDDSPVVTGWEPKSISRETTYQWDTRRRDTIVSTMTSLVDDVVEELREEGYAARTVTVKIRYRDFRTHTRAQTLPGPVEDAAAVRTTAIALLERFAMDRPVRLVGVRLSNLRKPGTGDQEPGTSEDQSVAES
jgi:DNA polymerase-4